MVHYRHFAQKCPHQFPIFREQSGGDCRTQAQIQSVVIQSKGSFPEQHPVPNRDKLRRAAGEPGYKAPSVGGGIGIYRRNQKAGILKGAPPVRFRRKKRYGHSCKVHKEAVIIAACKQRQQILVFHMYPDGLILQPSPWECPGPAHLETDILQRFIQFIHIQSPVQQRAVPDFICHTAFRRLRLPGTHPAGRPLQEKRKRRFSHFPGQYSGFHRSDAFCLIVEIGRTDSAVFFRFSCYGLPERRGQAVQNIGSFLCPESRPSAGETVLHLRSVPVAEPIPLHPLFIGGLMRLFQAVQGLQQVGNFFVHLYLIRENPLPFQQKI